MAGDPDDRGDGNLIRRVLADHGAGMIGLVGVADIGGDAGPVNREHRVLMQHGCAHMAQLPQLLIGNGGNLGRAVDHPGIRHQETGDIGPVLIHVSMDRTGNQGTGDITAAAGKGADLAVFLRPVETGHNGGLPVAQGGGELILGPFVIQGPVVIKDDPIGGVHKAPAQIISHQQSAEILPAAGTPVSPHAGGDALLHFIKTGGDIDLQMKTLGDGKITIPDFDKLVLEGLPLRSKRVTQIEQIGHLIVFGKALSGRTGDQVTAGGLQLQDAPDLPKLLIIGQRTAAELRYDTFKHRFPSKKAFRTTSIREAAGNPAGHHRLKAILPPEGLWCQSFSVGIGWRRRRVDRS